jgi:exopolyphosphatase/guanosine-5'-triphosphate,3'-diphosphate pyrophosphatase
MKSSNLIPNKIFAIDIGTNSIHGIIADIDESGNIREYFRDKESIRLGANIENGFINSKGIEMTISVLNKFKNNAESFSASIRAVATSAVREALNKDEFIEKVKKNTGIEIEVISGVKEGELIYKGVTKGLHLESENLMIIDIGGGSTEIIMGKNENITVQSLKLGAIRTSLKFFPDFVTNTESITNCQNHILETINLVKNSFSNKVIDKVIGSAGTIQAIARITLFNMGIHAPKFIENITLNIKDLEDSFDIILSKHLPQERAEIKGLESSRADLISTGALILQGILKEFSINNMIISTYSLREGIIFDTFEKPIN